MLALLRTLSARQLLLEQLPALVIAWVIAEAFFKWKSFTLEVAGFLVTWAVLEAGIQGVRWALAAVTGRVQPSR